MKRSLQRTAAYVCAGIFVLYAGDLLLFALSFTSAVPANVFGRLLTLSYLPVYAILTLCRLRARRAEDAAQDEEALRLSARRRARCETMRYLFHAAAVLCLLAQLFLVIVNLSSPDGDTAAAALMLLLQGLCNAFAAVCMGFVAALTRFPQPKKAKEAFFCRSAAAANAAAGVLRMLSQSFLSSKGWIADLAGLLFTACGACLPFLQGALRPRERDGTGRPDTTSKR